MINRILLFAFVFSIGLMSCEDERELVTEDPEIPNPVQLFNANLEGTISDGNQQPLSDVNVKIMYETFVLGQTMTDTEGKFTLANQPVHSTKTYVIISKSGYSPNIYNKVITENETVVLQPQLKKLSINQTLNDEKTEINLTSDIKVEFPPALVTSAGAKVKMQFFDFKLESKNHILADLGSDGEIKLNKVLWLDVVNENGDSLSLNPGTEVVVTLGEKIKKEVSTDVWFFDIYTARWVKTDAMSLVANNLQLKVKQPGFYALTSPCVNDTEKPTIIHVSLSTAILSPNQVSIMLYALDFDKGSYDNCDTDLDFTIRRQDDPCMNGANQFNPTITFCRADAGKTIKATLKVTDDNNNMDSVFIDISIVESTLCSNDTEKPTVICVQNQSVVLNPSTAGTLYAKDFDKGSYDNCTTNLDFKIRRLDDPCMNGDNQFKPYIRLCNNDAGKSFKVIIKVTDSKNNSDSVLVNIDVVGNSPCANDNVKPVAQAIKLSTVVFPNPGVMLYAIDFNNQSYDNCDNNLEFTIRREDDPCMNGDNNYKPFVTLCPSDADKTFKLILKVTDDNNNFDTAFIELTTFDVVCANDAIKPVPYCSTNVDVSYSANNGMVPASFFDAGSTDNCTPQSELTFKAKKIQTNVCSGGNNTLNPVLVFCPEEIGETLNIETRVYDKKGNWDFCTISINIIP